MITKVQGLGSVAAFFFLVGCSWQDDYRSRTPQVLEEGKLKTSNVSSEDYVNLETNQNLRNPPPKSMPSIDELSKIPEIQDGTD